MPWDWFVVRQNSHGTKPVPWLPAKFPRHKPSAVATRLRRLVEERLALFAILPCHLLIEIDAEAGLVGHLDIAFFDQGFFAAFDEVIEERDGLGVPFKRQEVRRGGA